MTKTIQTEQKVVSLTLPSYDSDSENGEFE